ncbi:PhoX family phosphatase [Jannaschia sp. LMIT008]|uniref:PhoX family protein n=1 Tax=Jannaschia maritima TaxID=3032585 RepID=UPI002810D0FD|nr:PhoX family phosphatase [Jannaschia sp. LMIT008]
MKYTVFDPANRSQRADASEDRPSNRSTAPTIGDVIAGRMNRRDMLKGALGFTAIAATVSPMALAAGRAHAAGSSAFGFEELDATVTADHAVAPGYDADVLIRWGDPVLADAPAFDPRDQTAEAQAKQFGYNNDFVGTVPHPEAPGDDGRHLMVVNHEYTNEELMFPGLDRQDGDLAFADTTRDMVDIEMAAHGGTVIEIRRDADGRWSTVTDSPYNRRIHLGTPMEISGPAAGHPKMRTAADPTGRAVLGTVNNCAGGITPWGTWLMAEENFNGYFWGEEDASAEEGLTDDDPIAADYARYGIPGNWYAWGKFHDRFDTAKEPNEPNRFGWMVEVDPSDPTSSPKKRTALGRMKHEGAHSVVNPDGRVVTFMGDDQRFDYVYRFVTNAAYDPANPNPDILDDGVLSVARYDADGSVTWLPLIHGEGPLTPENGFADQGDVMIQTRRAADFLEATPMDRPEDVEPNDVRGTVYVMLTNNTRRKPGDENAANPRPENAFGHIIEMTAPDGDFAADRMTWDILVRCGDPSVAEVGATFNPATSENGWFGMPDNCAVDAVGRLWVSTDGNAFEDTGRADGLWAVDTEGEARGTSRHFYRVPVGAELCGPHFLNDGEALLLAVQHPGDGDGGWPEFGRTSTFDDPSTRWPDFAEGMPPRPSVVTVTKQGGGVIG